VPETFKGKEAVVRGKVEIWSILQVCNSGGRLPQGTHLQATGSICLKNGTKRKALNLFSTEGGFSEFTPENRDAGVSL